MNTERLDRINAFLREESDLVKTMSEMDEQCERIRKYCLDAVADARETANAVLKVIRENTGMFPLGAGSCGKKRVVKTSDNTGYFHVYVEDGEFSDVYTTTTNGKGLVYFGSNELKTPFPVLDVDAH